RRRSADQADLVKRRVYAILAEMVPSVANADRIRSAPLIVTSKMLAQALRNWAVEMDADAETIPHESAARKGKVKGAGIGASMLKAPAENPESHGWSARQWAIHLDCSDGTVKATKTWKERLKAARATRLADAAARMDRSGTHPRGRRKHKHKSQWS